MKIRNAKLSDLKGIMVVEDQSFIPEIVESENVFAERLSAYPAGFFVLVDDENNIVGYFSSELWASVPKDSTSFTLGHSALENHCKNGSVLYVSSVAVLKSYRGKSLGEMLFNECVKEICLKNKNVKHGVLLVNDVWKGAKHIYEKNGFVEYSKIEKFFRTSDNSFTDGILMSKDFV